MAHSGIGWFIVISLTATLGYFLGLLTFLTDFEKNRCDMTYMYEYPQFVRILVKEDVLYEKYGLYAYSEGHLTKHVRNMHFNGNPVLFIHGNAGSYKQVRSFASVSLRKSLKSRYGVHFDFFTVNLNEELSGLNGALLNEQMIYVSHCISRILELYQKNGHTRKSIIVLAHSMGGIIAKGLLASLPTKSVLLPVIITLATPHLRPPVALDFYMTDFYKNIEKNIINKTSTVVALSGGFNDFLVPPFYTNTKELNFIHATTTSVPLVWLSVDHLCILWCKQLVLAVTRSLFALVDPSNHRLNLNSTYHLSVLNHYLVQHNGIKLHKLANYQTQINFTAINEKWIERFQNRYTVSLLEGVKQVEWHMIRLVGRPNHEYVTVLAINLEVTDWIFACTATRVHNQQQICSTAMHLSHFSEVVPSVANKRRLLTVNMYELRENFPNTTHINIRILPTREPIVFHVDTYQEHERKFDVKLPNWWHVGRQVILKETEESVIHYELVLAQLYHITQAYKLYVEPLWCPPEHSNHHAVASLNIPWANQNIHSYIAKHWKKPLDIRLFSSRPQGLNKSFPSVSLTLDPACTYSISIESSILGMLSNMARTYTPLLFANAAAVVLLSFRNQLIDIDRTGSCSVFFTAMKTGIKPYYILTMVKVTSRVLSWKSFTRILPIPDWQLILEEGNDFFLLPLLLYMCGVGTVWLISLGLITSMFICEASVNKMALKFLSRSLSGSLQLSDWIIHGLHRLPGVVAIILIVLSFTACGGVALLFGCMFYFMKLIQMSQEYVESIVIAYVKYYAKKLFTRQPNVQIPTVNNSPENIEAESVSTNDKVNERSTLNSAISETGEPSQCVKVKACPENNYKANRNVTQNENETNEHSNGEYPAAYSALFFHFSLMLLWGLVAGIHVPHVLTWARNFRFSTQLKPDPSFLPGLILSLCAIPLWQLEVPKANKSWYMPLSEILNLIAAAALLYAPLSLYRLVYLLTGAIVLVTLHQMFAPDRSDENDEKVQDTTDLESEVNKMKTKLE